MSDRRAQGFNPRVVLGLLLFGALTFLALLYFISSGQTGGNTNNGGSHAAGKGLPGYAGLVQMLKKRGHDVNVSRNASNLKNDGLLILTPPSYADAGEIASLIEERRWTGPTLVILPKWIAFPVPPQLALTSDVEVHEGWVMLAGTQEAVWAEDIDEESNSFLSAEGDPAPVNIDLQISENKTGWTGLGFSGNLPEPEEVQSIKSGNVQSLVTDRSGAILAGYVDDGGNYPTQDDDDTDDYNYEDDEGESFDDDYYDNWSSVTIVAEPDLMNNYGLADSKRAQMALELVEAAMQDDDDSITFDVTLNGLGETKNLLTLAFTPPFLAATICLLLAMIVIAWRAFLRFGPAIAEGRRIAFGKERLVRNSAGFIQRTGRLHLLSKPYADMMHGRIITALGLKHPDDEVMDAAFSRRFPDEQPISRQIAALEQARSQQDVLRSAEALQSIERKLSK